MEEALAELKRDCERGMIQAGLKREVWAKGCEPIWDGIMCWPAARPNQTLFQPCSPVIPGFDTNVCNFFLNQINRAILFRQMLANFARILAGGKIRLLTRHGRIIVIATQVL